MKKKRNSSHLSVYSIVGLQAASFHLQINFFFFLYAHIESILNLNIVPILKKIARVNSHRCFSLTLHVFLVVCWEKFSALPIILQWVCTYCVYESAYHKSDSSLYRLMSKRRYLLTKKENGRGFGDSRLFLSQIRNSHNDENGYARRTRGTKILVTPSYVQYATI